MYFSPELGGDYRKFSLEKIKKSKEKIEFSFAF